MNQDIRIMEERARIRGNTLLAEANSERLLKKVATTKPVVGLHLHFNIGESLITVDLNLNMWGRATSEDMGLLV